MLALLPAVLPPQLTGLRQALAEWLSMNAADQPILHQAQQVGLLRVSGDPRNLLQFLLRGALGLPGCLLLTRSARTTWPAACWCRSSSRCAT